MGEAGGGSMGDERPTRILVCEDQTLMRDGLVTVLALEPGFVVVGTAGDGAEAVRLAAHLRPDVILMDVQMPRQDGVQATAAITARGLPCRVIILTTFDYEDYVFEAIKAGAVGYLLKDIPAKELAATIRRVAAGESIIQPNVATRLLMEFGRRGAPLAPGRDDAEAARGRGARPGGDEGGADGLSQREVDVLRLLAQGASNREIADRLVLAEGTVKNHVSNILAKLHAANRTHAAQLARDRGLI